MTLTNLSKIIALLLLFAILFAGCTQQPATNTTGSGLMTLDANKPDSNKPSSVYNNLEDFKKVKKGDTIKVDYTGRLTDGTVFDTSIGREPLEFEVGAGQMIKGFDSAVVGMKVGETKTVELPPAEAYGEYDIQLVRAFDKNAFENFSLLSVGVYVYASNGLKGIIISKTDTNAVIDFNPELAGKTLTFEITLVSIN